MINLFINYYQTDNSRHQQEIDTCLARNLENHHIDLIFGIAESLPVSHPKLIFIQSATIPTFSDFFALANGYNYNLSSNIDGIYSVFANADIYFGEFPKLPGPNECFALLRWEEERDGHAAIFSENNQPRADSQDVWIFKGLIKPLAADFYMGHPGCDNRLAYELEVAGYKVTNPALTFKTYHLHNYRQDTEKTAVPPPYRLLTPEW